MLLKGEVTMKIKKKIFLTAVLAALIVGVSIPQSMYAQAFHSLFDRYSPYSAKTEDEILAEKRELSADELIQEINECEAELPNTSDLSGLLPWYTALIDKSSEFSSEELIDLMKRTDTLTGMECACVKMYAINGYDSSNMLMLLDDPDIANETKDYIVSKCDFTVNELCDIFRNHDGNMAVIAMKKITADDAATALQLAQEIADLNGTDTQISDEQYVSFCLGVANYYENTKIVTDVTGMKDTYISIIKGIYADSDSELVKNQAVYALSRICDYDLFTWLIENNDIDFLLKVSVIERNVNLMKEQIAVARTEADIHPIMQAMRLHPILDVADALNDSFEHGTLTQSKKLSELVDYIMNNGVKAVDKYD